MNQDPMNSPKPMNAEPEITCPDCGKACQPDLANGLGGACPHCLARMLAEETPEKDHAGGSSLSFTAGDTFGGVKFSNRWPAAAWAWFTKPVRPSCNVS